MKIKTYSPNPQGKGLVPLLQALSSGNQSLLEDRIAPKQIDQVQMELFTSMFVLQSDIKFNPVVLRSYWLYHTDGSYRLLLVAPHEWNNTYRGRFVGECVLQHDRTWSLSLAAELADDEAFMQDLECERKKLQLRLETAANIDEVLPVYEKSFSFYSRVLAFSLSKSLGLSMQLSGIKGLSYQEARGLLTYECEEKL